LRCRLLQPYPVKVGVGVAALAGQSRLKTAEDDGVSLEGNEEILLGIEGRGPNGEETVARVGEFVRSAVIKMGRIGNGDERAGGESVVLTVGDGDDAIGGDGDAAYAKGRLALGGDCAMRVFRDCN
jgi:hypothetical protein